MKRDIYQRLLRWKDSAERKPLILQGARQTGKTYILQELGREAYESTCYFNFEEDVGLDHFFQKNLAPHRIIRELGIYSKREIRPGRDLIIFDEIQSSSNALAALKYFQEQANDYHLAAAGSLLGVKLAAAKPFPVGKVNFLNLYPLSFAEFLDAVGEERYRRYLGQLAAPDPLPQPFHEELISLLRSYYFTGGMPEAVSCFVRSGDPVKVRTIHKEIINSYLLDFAKHAPTADIPKLSHIWESIPGQLARENKKFMFSAIRKSARARDYENAIIWLEDAGLIHRCFAASTAKQPLSSYLNRDIFKVYALDVGLLGALANIPPEIMVAGDRLFHEFQGAFVENYVAQHLRAMFEQPLVYWKSSGRVAELDFLCEINGIVLPLEVKAGINPKSKSLLSFDNQFHPPLLSRATLLNLKRDGKILNIPLYALNNLRQLI
ncbi:MAG: AAA family ATPase [Desulfurivibrio sp.]|nr:AAA family ATPase [Desulfurivibrio sp.]